MPRLSKLVLTLITFAALGLAAPVVKADTFTFVGSFNVSDGPFVFDLPVPPAYTARQAAALLFGGSPTDYAISTNGSDPLNVNRLAFADQYSNGLFLFTPVSEDFSIGGADGLYNTPGDVSAFVRDHFNIVRTNYVFRVNADATPTPEPATMLLLGTGLAGVFAKVHKRRKTRPSEKA